MLGNPLLPVLFIWDFDGVVVFTPHYEAWMNACVKHGLRGFNHEFYDKYVSGRPRIEGALAILEKLGGYSREYLLWGEGRRILEEFMEYKNEVFRSLIKENKFEVNMDAVNYIASAREAGIIQALASASRNAEIIARHARLPRSNKPLVELFDVNVSGRASSKLEVFKLALREAEEKAGGRILECVIVYEDSLSGIRAAKQLGLKTVGYNLPSNMDPGRVGVDLVIERFSEHTPLEIVYSVGCRLP